MFHKGEVSNSDMLKDLRILQVHQKEFKSLYSSWWSGFALMCDTIYL